MCMGTARHVRCGLHTCLEERECGWPTDCVGLKLEREAVAKLVPRPSAVSTASPKVSEAQVEAGVRAECLNCGTRDKLSDICASKSYSSCCPERDMRLLPLELSPELLKVCERDPYGRLAALIRDPMTPQKDRMDAARVLQASPYGGPRVVTGQYTGDDATWAADIDRKQAERLELDIASFGEVAWRIEGESCDWTIPTKRHWFKRLPVIRHIGALVLSWQVHTYSGEWSSIGIGVGGPSAYDLWCVEGAFHGYW